LIYEQENYLLIFMVSLYKKKLVKIGKWVKTGIFDRV